MKNNLNEMKEKFNAEDFSQAFGIELLDFRDNIIKMSLKVDSRHLRPGGIMNGGVSLLVVETTASISSYLMLDTQKQNAFGIQVNANHIGVVKPGDVITATSSAVHLGRTTHIWDVSLINQNEKLVCSGRVTLLVTNL